MVIVYLGGATTAWVHGFESCWEHISETELLSDKLQNGECQTKIKH